MKISTYDKDGEINISWLNVKKIKLLVIPNKKLLNLHITFDNGTETDYYLSEYERFAIIE